MRKFFSSIFNRKEKVRVTDLNFEEFENRMKNENDAVVIDVRTLGEYSSGRIPNSLHLDVSNPNFLIEINKLDQNKDYLLYCQSGSRSYYAGKAMLKNGFKSVSHLTYGISQWRGQIEY